MEVGQWCAGPTGDGGWTHFPPSQQGQHNLRAMIQLLGVMELIADLADEENVLRLSRMDRKRGMATLRERSSDSNIHRPPRP